ncbi:MAG: M48 family metallopeptidase [Firmicutes bacterium]|nr:M48 family metallopeptidase [Bacillota bacterium]
MNINLGGNNILVKVIYKNNRNIYFRFDENAVLVVTCPKGTLDDEISKLITKNENALIKMYNSAIERNKYNNEFWLLGKKYNVVLNPDLDNTQINGDYIYSKDEMMLDKYVNEEINRVFNEEIDICKRCFHNLPEFKLKTRKMKTRWGVCNRKDNTITLNTELIKKDVELLDYVIIHEMAHFYEGNHSKAFWDIVAKACPSYKERRARLKK